MSRDRINEVFFGEAGDEATITLARERIEWIIDQARGDRILDLGTSQGVVAHRLAARGASVWAVDLDLPSLAHAHRDRDRFEGDRRALFAQADGDRLPFGDGLFDMVVFTETLEHLEEPAGVLAEIARVLAPEGRLVLTTPLGLLPHDDHKRSYFLHSLLTELAPFFAPLEIDVQDSHFIRSVAVHVSRETPEIDDAHALFEEAILDREVRYQAEISNLQSTLNEANRKYHGVTGTLKQVQDQLALANEKYRQVTKTVSELKEREGEAERDVGDAADQAASFIARIARRENRWDQVRADLEQRIEAGATAQDELQQEIDTTNQRLAQASEDAASEREKRAALERALDEERGERVRLADLLTEAASERETLEQRLAQASHREEELESAIEAAAAERAQTEARLEAAESSLTIAGLAARRSRQAAGAIAESLEAERARLDEAREQSAALEEERDRLGTLAENAQTETLGVRQELTQVTELKDAYIERYTNAVRSFQRQKAHSGDLDTQLKRARYQLGVIEASKAWKLTQLYWRWRREGTSRALLADVGGILRRRLGLSRRERRFEERLEAWLDRTAKSRADRFVFMFSGTTFIQEHRGNRPIRLSRILLERKVPVLFSYWRWKKSEALPPESDARLFQSPIDLTMDHLDAIARRPMPGKKKIFVITFPHVACARAAALFNAHGWVTIYDVRDEWEEFHKVGAANWYDGALERYIANNVDVVTAVSKPLRAKIGAYLREGEVYLSPNALDTRFATGKRVEVRPVDGVKTLGYVGHLTEKWFDWDALIAAARAEPEWRFEIVGHSMPDGLDLPPNLVYLGPKDHREILALAREWRVALIPFQVSKLADGVDPIKVYEYLAMGLPVVSFRMPQIHDYPYVLIAEGAEGLRQRCAEAFELPMDGQVIERFLAVNRWQDRVDQLLAWEANDARTGHLAAITGN